MRYVVKDPPIWGDRLTVLSNIWLVFFALALTVRDKDHNALDLIYNWLPRMAAFLFALPLSLRSSRMACA